MKVVIKPAYQSEKGWIMHLPSFFDSEGIIIHNGRNVVKSYAKKEGEWIVKRYKKPHLIQRIAYTFWRKTKARRAYEFADRLRAMSIDTPESIAYIEIKKSFLFKTGFFVSAASHLPSLYVLNEEKIFDTCLADALAHFLVKLHQKGVLHGDLNLTNILYGKEEQTYHFSVIDTNRSLFKSSLSKEECLDNLKRLTHRRDLMEYIVRQYAIIRGWNIQEVLETVMNLLNLLELKEKTKRLLKNKKVINA